VRPCLHDDVVCLLCGSEEHNSHECPWLAKRPSPDPLDERALAA